MSSDQTIDYEELHQTAMRGLVRSVLVRIAKSGLPGEHHFYIAFNTGAPGTIVSKRLKEKYPDEMTIVLQHRFWELIVLDDRFEVKLTFDGIPERLIVPYTAIKVFFDPSVPYGLQFEDPDGNDAQRTPGDRQLRRTQDGSGERTGRSLTKSLADKSLADKSLGDKGDRKKAVRKPRPERVAGDKIEQDVHADEAPPAEPVAAKPATPARPAPFSVVPASDPAVGDGTGAQPKVVSLDAFRKK
jgi:uncharacterized protein